MSPSNVNNAIRELMAHLKNMEDGTDAVTAIKSGNIQITSNTITSTDTNGNINITPNGTGSVVLDGINYPQADGTANYFLKTDGAGQLSFAQVDTASIADDAITAAKIADNSIGAAALNVSGSGTAGQVLQSDGDGSFTWVNTADPFTPTTVSGTTPSLDLGTYNYFSSGTLTGNTTLSFTNVPTAKRFFYDQTSDGGGYGFTQATTSSTSQSFSSEFKTTTSAFVGDSGNKLYIGGRNAASTACIIYEYDLSTANDITTASTSYSYSLSSLVYNGDYSVGGIQFKPDGTRMYVIGQQTNSPYEYYTREFTLSTAWDLSTATNTHGFLSYAQRKHFAPNATGTTFTYTDSSAGGVTVYNLSTAWDLSTISYGSAYTSGLPLSSDNPDSLMYNSDGTQAFILCRSNAEYIIDLSTPYDWSTASFNTSVNIPSSRTSVTPFDSGKKFLYSTDYTTATLNVGNMINPYTLSFPASVQNSDYAATQSFNDRYLHEFITTDGGTNVWLVGSTKYDDN
jgi:hypothetical protein